MNITNMHNSALSEEITDKILRFWFGDLKEGEIPENKYRKRWWVKDAVIDNKIKEEFQEDLKAAKDIRLDNIKPTPRGSLALIILLDQFSRNIYRDTPEAFSQDALALEIALFGTEKGLDLPLHPFERVFYYMPFMHSEDPEIHNLSLDCFSRLKNEYPEPEKLNEKLRGFREYADAHVRIIERFGRYPHRNEILGRESTQQEKEFLSGPGSSF